MHRRKQQRWLWLALAGVPLVASFFLGGKLLGSSDEDSTAQASEGYTEDEEENSQELVYGLIWEQIQRQATQWDALEGRMRLILGVVSIVFAATIGLRAVVRGAELVRVPWWVTVPAGLAVIAFLVAAAIIAIELTRGTLTDTQESPNTASPNGQTQGTPHDGTQAAPHDGTDETSKERKEPRGTLNLPPNPAILGTEEYLAKPRSDTMSEMIGTWRDAYEKNGKVIEERSTAFNWALRWSAVAIVLLGAATIGELIWNTEPPSLVSVTSQQQTISSPEGGDQNAPEGTSPTTTAGTTPASGEP